MRANKRLKEIKGEMIKTKGSGKTAKINKLTGERFLKRHKS